MRKTGDGKSHPNKAPVLEEDLGEVKDDPGVEE